MIIALVIWGLDAASIDVVLGCFLWAKEPDGCFSVRMHIAVNVLVLEALNHFLLFHVVLQGLELTSDLFFGSANCFREGDWFLVGHQARVPLHALPGRVVLIQSTVSEVLERCMVCFRERL